MSGVKYPTKDKLVTLYPPSEGTGKNAHLWRVTYKLDGKPRSTTVGTDEAEARKAVAELHARLVAGTTVKSEQPISAMIAYWLDPQRARPKDEPWSDSHAYSMGRFAENHFIPAIGKVRCADLRVRDIQTVVNRARSKSQGEKLRAAAYSLIRSGRQGEFLLDTQHFDLRDVRRHGLQTRKAAEAAEGEGFIDHSKRPKHEQVRALAEAAAARETRKGPVWWRGLMVYTAAYTGVRLGELLALTCDSVNPDTRSVLVQHQVVEAVGKPQRLDPPKMSKQRRTLYLSEPVPGLDFAGMMRKRVDEAHAERVAGTNPKGLLFPTPAGDWWIQRNFKRDVFEPAAKAAGWPMLRGKDGPLKGDTRVWTMNWHSLRHTFCTTALDEWGMRVVRVALLAGHRSTATTQRLYIGATTEEYERALAETS